MRESVSVVSPCLSGVLGFEVRKLCGSLLQLLILSLFWLIGLLKKAAKNLIFSNPPMDDCSAECQLGGGN